MPKNLQDSINWVRPSLGYKRVDIGTANEPALTAGNMTKQVMLSSPFKFNFNRGYKTFQISANTQDYAQAISDFGYMEKATFQPSANITSITANGTTAVYTATNSFKLGALVTVTGLTHSAFNVTNAVITAVSSSTFSVALVQTLTPTSDTGVAASGQIKEFSRILNLVGLAPSNDQQQPTTLAAQLNDNAGNITFRTLGVPNASYQVVVVYQKLATPFTSLSDSWTPLPDFMAYVYNLGFRAHLYECLGDLRAQQAKVQFAAAMLSYSEGLSETEINLFLVQYLGDAAQVFSKQLGTQQGVSARGQ